MAGSGRGDPVLDPRSQMLYPPNMPQQSAPAAPAVLPMRRDPSARTRTTSSENFQQSLKNRPAPAPVAAPAVQLDADGNAYSPAPPVNPPQATPFRASVNRSLAAKDLGSMQAPAIAAARAADVHAAAAAGHPTAKKIAGQYPMPMGSQPAPTPAPAPLPPAAVAPAVPPTPMSGLTGALTAINPMLGAAAGAILPAAAQAIGGPLAARAVMPMPPAAVPAPAPVVAPAPAPATATPAVLPTDAARPSFSQVTRGPGGAEVSRPMPMASQAEANANNEALATGQANQYRGVMKATLPDGTQIVRTADRAVETGPAERQAMQQARAERAKLASIQRKDPEFTASDFNDQRAASVQAAEVQAVQKGLAISADERANQEAAAKASLAAAQARGVDADIAAQEQRAALAPEYAEAEVDGMKAGAEATRTGAAGAVARNKELAAENARLMQQNRLYQQGNKGGDQGVTAADIEAATMSDDPEIKALIADHLRKKLGGQAKQQGAASPVAGQPGDIGGASLNSGSVGPAPDFSQATDPSTLKPMPPDIARQILQEAGGDKQKAIQLAQQRGFNPFK